MRTPWILLTLPALLAVGTLAATADEELVNFDKLWDYAQPDETEKRFRELLPKAEASGNLDYQLQLLTQIARTEGLQGRFDEAHATLDGVEAKLAGANPATRMRYLLERGRTFNSSKKVKEARALFLEAWEFGLEKKADYFALDAAHMLAIVEPQEKQLAWNEKALKLAETSKDERTRLWLGTLYNNIGWTLYYLERYDEALDVHQKGWEWRKARKQVEPTLIAKWSVAKVLRALKRHDEALAMQAELLEAWAKLEKPDGFVHEELAENLLALGKAEEAKPHFVQAWALLKGETWIDDDEPGRSERLRTMAGAEEAEGQDTEAE